MAKVTTSADRRKKQRLGIVSGASFVAPTLRSSRTGYTGGSNFTQNIALPAGALAGDLLILWGVGPVSAVTKSANGGQTWTQVLTAPGTGYGYSAWWAIFNGTLTTVTLDVPASGAPVWAVGMIAISGVNASTPMDATPTFVNGGTTTGVQTIPAITTVTDGALRVVLYGVHATNGISSCMSGFPAGQVISYNQIDAWLGNARCDALGSTVQTPAGTSALEQFTQGLGAGTRSLAHFAIRPT